MYALDTFRSAASISAECAALYPAVASDAAAVANQKLQALNTCQQSRSEAAQGQRMMFGVGIASGLLIAHFFWK